MIDVLAGFDGAAAVLALGMIWVLIILRDARRNGFSWAKALQDENGKESSLRLAIVVCLVISSWVLMYVTINVVKSSGDLEQLFPFFLAFLIVWSGAKVAEKAIELIIAKLKG